jgi:hypothetical protein
MTAREIRRILEKHKIISDRMSEVITEMRDIDGYNSGADVSQPKASNRNLVSSVEIAVEKRSKLNKELGQLLDKERQSYWEIQDLLSLCRGSYRIKDYRLISDCYIGELSKEEMISKYGIDYVKDITAAISRMTKQSLKIS